MNKPLSNDDISRLLDNKVKVITNYKDLANYNSLEELLYPYNRVVILYNTTNNYGHWTCLFKYPKGNSIEFFDPYGDLDGAKPDSELDYAHASGSDPILLKLIHDWTLRTKGNVFYNTNEFQRLSRDVATCGRWCVFRLWADKHNLESFVELFKKCPDPDRAVTNLTS